jgi:hypothetical protein
MRSKYIIAIKPMEKLGLKYSSFSTVYSASKPETSSPLDSGNEE